MSAGKAFDNYVMETNFKVIEEALRMPYIATGGTVLQGRAFAAIASLREERGDLIADIAKAEAERDEALKEAELKRIETHHANAKRNEYEAEKERILYIAERLFQMIPQDVWREHGAEWMGQYEGDYHAEKVRKELAEYRENIT